MGYIHAHNIFRFFSRTRIAIIFSVTITCGVSKSPCFFYMRKKLHYGMVYNRSVFFFHLQQLLKRMLCHAMFAMFARCYHMLLLVLCHAVVTNNVRCKKKTCFYS